MQATARKTPPKKASKEPDPKSPTSRDQPRTLEEARAKYPEVGTTVRTVGGTFPDREGVVTGITDKTPQSGWLFLLEVTLRGGVVEHSWEVPAPNGKKKEITQRHAVKEQLVRLQPGS